MTHIQNTAPGPPIAMAVATPARFPVPTLEASEIVNALKDDIPFVCFVELFDSVSRRIISLKLATCTPRVFMVNHRAAPKRSAIMI